MSELTVPYLPEHQAPDNFNSGTPGYDPPAEDKKVLQLVDSLYSRAKKYRKRYDQRWIDWYKMFRGRQWKEVRPAYRHSEVVNLIFEAVQSMVPILTDSRPSLEFLPTVAGQGEVAEILTKVAANDWEHNNWLYTLTEIIIDAHLYGTGMGYVGFNPKAEMGLGAIEFESQDIFYAFPDPQARNINGKRTKHFITAEPVDVSQVKKEYANNPDAKWIAADVIDFQQGDKADIYQVMFKSPTDSKLIVEGPSGYDSIAKNQTLKITVYSKEDDFDEEAKIELGADGSPTLDENGEEKETFVQKLCYPKGRKIVVAGGVLLEDGEQEFDDGLFPFALLTNYILPREFWGCGDVENLDGPQKTFNKICSFVLDTLTLMSNPIWVVDDSAGIDTDNLFNKPGLIVEKAQGSDVHREPGVELPGYVLPLLDRYRAFFNGVSGQTDLSKGVEPSNVTAASAIEDLQQAQQTRLRQKSRNIDAFLQDFGKLYLSRVFQFYSVPRIVRISGDENADAYFYFHVEHEAASDDDGNPLMDETGAPAVRRYAVTTTQDGSAKKAEIIGDFDIRVATGSSLPFAKEAKGEMAINLFKLGLIDDEEVLKDLDYPNYEAVLQRTRQKQQQAGQMKNQIQMAGAQAKIAETQSKAQKNQVDAVAVAKEAGLLSGGVPSAAQSGAASPPPLNGA